MREKFYEEEMSCQFLSNCGQLIFLMLVFCMIKGIFWMLKNVVSAKGQLKSKMAINMIKINNYINIEFFISIMDMF